MNDWVNVNMLLQGGALIGAAVDRKDAEILVMQHAVGEMPSTVGSHLFRCRADVMAFSVQTDKILAVYLTPAPPITGQPLMTPLGPYPSPRS